MILRMPAKNSTANSGCPARAAWTAVFYQATDRGRTGVVRMYAFAFASMMSIAAWETPNIVGLTHCIIQYTLQFINSGGTWPDQERGAERQEPSILWIASVPKVLSHEHITFPAQSPTLDIRIRLQIPLNLLCHYLVRRAKGVTRLPEKENEDDSGC